MKKYFLFSTLFFVAPLVSFAATDLDGLIDYVFIIIRYGLRIAVPVAILIFSWNLIKFIYSNREGSGDLKKYQKMLIWSGVAIFMMVGIWSVVAWVQSSLGKDALKSDIKEGPAMPQDIM